MFSVDSRTAAPRGDVQRLYEPLLCFPFSGMLYCISSDTQRWGFLWGWGGVARGKIAQVLLKEQL